MAESKPIDIVIIGAGIAGCSAAIALATAGHNVRILEKQTAWNFQSSGIFVYSNGLVALQGLGVLKDILESGYSIPSGINAYFDHTGRPIVETRYPDAGNGSVPAIVGIKRAELHRVLARRMSVLGVPIVLGAEITNIAQSESQVTVSLSDNASFDADLVIGADGVHSWVRSQIAPCINPHYSGFGVWRSVHKKAPDLTQKIMMMGNSKRYGIMPISDDRLYTFGTVAHPENTYIPPESWVEEMRRQFAEFTGPAAPYLAELGDENEVLFTAVEEVVMPLPWHRGRVLLIGDASHASTPFMGQGGAMAMQDALVIDAALAASDTVPQALTLFGNMRFPVCRYVQEVSRAVGESGANSELSSLSERNAKFKQSAQASVDRFYTELSRLNAESDQLLKAAADKS